MNRTDLSQTSQAYSRAPLSRCYYLSMGHDGIVIVNDDAEERRFIVGQLAVFGVGVFALAVAVLVQTLFHAAY